MNETVVFSPITRLARFTITFSSMVNNLPSFNLSYNRHMIIVKFGMQFSVKSLLMNDFLIMNLYCNPKLPTFTTLKCIKNV